MSDIPAFPYSILWGERSIRSVANLTRRDGEEFMGSRRACPCARRRPHIRWVTPITPSTTFAAVGFAARPYSCREEDVR